MREGSKSSNARNAFLWKLDSWRERLHLSLHQNVFYLSSSDVVCLLFVRQENRNYMAYTCCKILLLKDNFKMLCLLPWGQMQRCNLLIYAVQLLRCLRFINLQPYRKASILDNSKCVDLSKVHSHLKYDKQHCKGKLKCSNRFWGWNSRCLCMIIDVHYNT